jgi:hypothetical protein
MATAVGSHFIAGSGDLASAASAHIKSELLDDILQEYFQSRGLQFNGTDISENEVPKAIAYARGKKSTKAKRKLVVGTSKFAIHTASTAAGATVGSIVPVAGTAIGAVGGFAAGGMLSFGVTLLDRIKRTGKGIYKHFKGTRGEHRQQAAACLMINAKFPGKQKTPNSAAAEEALQVLLQQEYEQVLEAGDVERLAERLKSN